jgi:carbonic anhydrase/acetyltransferase-like protein (isoleucine patch superfamily)
MTLQELQKFFPDATVDTWHRHPTGGGWVQNTAHVEASARVSGDALVSGNAWVYGDARVSGDARVYGNALVSGKARVYGNARVYGYARVYGDAWVYGDARVYGDALVSGDALVYGNARVYGNALVYGNARVSGDAWEQSPMTQSGRTHSVSVCAYGKIAIGCTIHTITEWKRIGKKIAKSKNINKEQFAELKIMFGAAVDWMKLYKVDKPTNK